jgi:hypothetical protein
VSARSTADCQLLRARLDAAERHHDVFCRAWAREQSSTFFYYDAFVQQVRVIPLVRVRSLNWYSSSHHGLPSSAMSGVVLATLISLGLVVLLVYYIHLRRRRRRRRRCRRDSSAELATFAGRKTRPRAIFPLPAPVPTPCKGSRRALALRPPVVPAATRFAPPAAAPESTSGGHPQSAAHISNVQIDHIVELIAQRIDRPAVPTMAPAAGAVEEPPPPVYDSPPPTPPARS